MRRFLEALAVWLVVAVVLWLVAKALLQFDSSVTQSVGNFLDQTCVIIGLLAGVWHYFFGNPLQLR